MVGTVGNNLGIGAFVTKVDLVGAALIFVVWTCNYSRFPGRRDPPRGTTQHQNGWLTIR